MLAELREGPLSLETRRALAAEAFAVTAAYDAAIARWFAEAQFFPEQLTLTFRKLADLAYGENPHQTAAYYEEVGSRSHLLSRVSQLGGRELSYNNLADLEAARRIAREFAEPAAVIVKHANPCGVAVAETIEEAYERALAADPVSAFGCVMVVNRPDRRRRSAARIAEQFVEVLLAPEIDDEALEVLRRKPALRILRTRERRADTPGERDYRRVLGGLLVQQRDAEIDEREGMEVVAGDGRRRALGRARSSPGASASTRARTRSCSPRERQTIGIGAGQTSRVDAVQIALEKARRFGHELARRGARERRVLPLRRRPASSRSTPGVAALDPARRLQARRGGARGGRERRARRWSSPAAATSATSASRRVADPTARARSGSAARRRSATRPSPAR